QSCCLDFAGDGYWRCHRYSAGETGRNDRNARAGGDTAQLRRPGRRTGRH
ncbi:hypothetical protein COLO4_01054, partial [Corchorus olitorius]